MSEEGLISLKRTDDCSANVATIKLATGPAIPYDDEHVSPPTKELLRIWDESVKELSSGSNTPAPKELEAVSQEEGVIRARRSDAHLLDVTGLKIAQDTYVVAAGIETGKPGNSAGVTASIYHDDDGLISMNRTDDDDHPSVFAMGGSMKARRSKSPGSGSRPETPSYAKRPPSASASASPAPPPVVEELPLPRCGEGSGDSERICFRRSDANVLDAAVGVNGLPQGVLDLNLGETANYESDGNSLGCNSFTKSDAAKEASDEGSDSIVAPRTDHDALDLHGSVNIQRSSKPDVPPTQARKPRRPSIENMISGVIAAVIPRRKSADGPSVEAQTLAQSCTDTNTSNEVESVSTTASQTDRLEEVTEDDEKICFRRSDAHIHDLANLQISPEELSQHGITSAAGGVEDGSSNNVQEDSDGTIQMKRTDDSCLQAQVDSKPVAVQPEKTKKFRRPSLENFLPSAFQFSSAQGDRTETKSPGRDGEDTGR